MATTVDWPSYGYVVASSYRQKIVLELLQSPKTPKQLSQRTGIYLSHVSKVIADLSEKNLVSCLTPKLRRGRVFALNKAGKEIAQHLRRAG